MKIKLLYLVLIFSFTLSCEKENKKNPPLPEIPETIKEIDSINAMEVDSVSPTETIPSRKKSVSIPKAVDSNAIKEKNIPKIPSGNKINITPINHATFVIESASTVIYVDPVGGKEVFAGFRPPDFILVTDIHGDHFDIETIRKLIVKKTFLIGPRAVRAELTTDLLKNFDLVFNGISQKFSTSKVSMDIEGIAMYNLREEALKYHEKGRGNGYVLSLNGKRIYISGDTEDIPEMRRLKNIDIAFICMNLPYTMTVESAADAVLEFQPRKVYPYHYRGSDVGKFKRLVNMGNKNIKVVQLNWYPESL